MLSFLSSLFFNVAQYRLMVSLPVYACCRSGLRQLVEQTIGHQGSGGKALADIVAGQSS
jgi:hypothetical protein